MSIGAKEQLRNQVINELLRDLNLEAEEAIFMGFKKQGRMLLKVCARLKKHKERDNDAAPQLT